MDDADDGESHCDKTSVDNEYNVRCELVHPVATYGFNEVEIVNEHMHAQISHQRVDEHYVDVTYGFLSETGIDCGNMVNAMFDEEMKVEVVIMITRYETV